MNVRLGFAIAAHLEPEILLVDEVLAVGDLEFQRKCLGKMEDVAGRGRTVLFVSHNMAVVENLCRKCVLLAGGQVVCVDDSAEVIASYHGSGNEGRTILSERTDRKGSGLVKGVAITIHDGMGRRSGSARSGGDVEIRLHFEVRSGVAAKNVLVGFLLSTNLDTPVFLQHSGLTNTDFGALPARGVFVCRIPRLPLVPGRYLITFSVLADRGVGGNYLDSVRNAAELQVVEGDFYGSGVLPNNPRAASLVDAAWHLATERD
ncbi:MAG: ABC transporter ATP-binding protein, partial [Deltaproteobacteria bacterium]|nr:ABC transporter ATP-binding protein [Deltaproteobacteria bacterium]